MNAFTPHGSPLALVVDDRDERTRWLVRLLEDAGYAVLRERLGRHAIGRARAAQPDLIIIGAELSDVAGIDVCRSLRGEEPIGGPPIVMVMSQPANRDMRLAALRAGAWDCITPPHDAEEILIKLHTFIGAKRETDRVRSEGLLDPPTGLYNRLGLARRARELGSEAFRSHGPLACIVIAFDPQPGQLADGESIDSAMSGGITSLRSAARRSDIVGRLGPAEFAVLAPNTDAAGARRLAERLADAVHRAAPGLTLRCGYDAVASVGSAPIEPVQLLVRAAAAVRVGRAEPSPPGAEIGADGWIRRFTEGDDERD